MSLDADAIVDRRRLRRKLTFWRVVALLVVVLAISGAAIWAIPGARLTAGAGSIARIKIQGLIRNNQDRVDALDRLAKSRVRAVIVHIDSPGGTTSGSQQLYDSLRALQARKPMVVVVDGLAASGAYIAALSADHIIAHDTSLVGSIGVLFQYPNFTQALKTLGIQVESIKSTPLKAAPSGFEPTSPEARAAIQAIVLNSYAWFKNLVQTRRHMDGASLPPSTTAAFSRAARACRSNWSMPWATNRARALGSPWSNTCRLRRRYAIIRCGRASASFLSCMSPPGPSKRWAFRPLHSASRIGAECRRWRD